MTEKKLIDMVASLAQHGREVDEPLAETDRMIKELVLSRKEVDRSLKELAESGKRVDRRLDELAESGKEDGIAAEVWKEGFYLARISDDVFELDVPESFTPRPFPPS